MKKLKTKKPFSLDVKRLHLPFKMDYVCPECKNENTVDLEHDHLYCSKANKVEYFYTCCDQCDAELQIPILLKISLSFGEAELQ